MSADDIVRYNAIIVDSDLAARMRLKTAANSVVDFGSVRLISTLSEALQYLEGGERCDVAFISYRLDRQEITNFIAQAKEITAAEDAAFVLVLSTDDQDSSTVASSVMMGGDGFLLEPFSVDNLIEITHLAAKVKKERSAAREALAINFLVKDIMKQVDKIAYIKSCMFDVGRSTKKLKDMCDVCQGLEEEAVQNYYDIALKSFEDAPIPKMPVDVKKYKGSSSRVRKRMEAKILAALDEDEAAETEEAEEEPADESDQKTP